MNIEEIISKLQPRIIAEFNPKYIFMFGSYAKKNQTVESDLDLAVIVDLADKTLLKVLNRRASQLLWELKLDIPVDLIIMSLSFFNKKNIWMRWML